MKNNQRKSNTKKNLSRRESFRFWMDSHKLLGFFLVFGLILGIGIGINLIFKSLPIPSPYRDINYSFPLYINLFCLVYRLFDYWFLDLSGTRMTIKDMQIYLFILIVSVQWSIFLSGLVGKIVRGSCLHSYPQITAIFGSLQQPIWSFLLCLL